MIGSVARLCKVRVSALAAASAATGYLLASGGFDAGLFPTALALFLVACGSSAMNQIQERKLDTKMLRTRTRPIPSGEIDAGRALAVSVFLTAGGLVLLLAAATPLAAMLAASAALWYNGVYTYLKRVTPFAAIPGGLVGAIPPAVGWAAAGGVAFGPEIISLMAFMFIWQVPHFWLLLIVHREDYRRAGFPAVTDTFSTPQLGRIVFVWILAAAVCPLMVPVLAGGAYLAVPLLILLSVLWLVPHAAARLGRDTSAAGAVYVRLNVFALIVLTSLSAGAVLGGAS